MESTKTGQKTIGRKLSETFGIALCNHRSTFKMFSGEKASYNNRLVSGINGKECLLLEEMYKKEYRAKGEHHLL